MNRSSSSKQFRNTMTFENVIFTIDANFKQVLKKALDIQESLFGQNKSVDFPKINKCSRVSH